MVRIVMNSVEKKFGDETVIPNMNLEIKDKEFLVLVGPSGCGKSTMLNLIAGLEYPTSGSIFFDDKEVTYLNPRDRNIAMVFQSYALYPHMNTYDNMAFSLKLAKMDKKLIDERVHRAAQILQIEDLLNKKPKQMSGGQRQRVALGRAIVRDPSIFLLDEPLSNLDAKLRVEMRAEIIRLQKTLQTTMCYVTHDQTEAMSMADRIAIINKGEIQQVGTPFEVYNFPKNVFVAGFIGSPSMNFLSGSIQQEGSDYYLVLVGKKLRLTGKRVEAAKIFLEKCKNDNLEPEVIIGIRPEHLLTGYKEEDTIIKPTIEQDERLEKVSPSSGSISVLGTVFVVEHLGAGTYITMELNDDILKERIGIMLDGFFDANINDQLYIRLYEPYLHIFDKNNKNSLLTLL
ncbi:MAG: ABC transporter ATP-binding protein [Candidatus Hodarchaeales archaeon]